VDRDTLKKIVNDPGFYGPLNHISSEHNCSEAALLCMLNKVFDDSLFRYGLMCEDSKD
jgi:hypothetical protein